MEPRISDIEYYSLDIEFTGSQLPDVSAPGIR